MRSGPGRNGPSASSTPAQGDRHRDHAASHPTGRPGASSTSSQGRLSTRRSALRIDQVVRPRPVPSGRDGGPGRLEPGGEQAPADRPQCLRIDQRATVLLEQVQEPTLQVGHRLGRLVMNRDGPTDRMIIAGPLRLANLLASSGIDLEQ